MVEKLDMFKQPQNLFTYIVLIPMNNGELFMYYSLYLGSNGLIALRGIANVWSHFFWGPHVQTKCPIYGFTQ
jgi:hypothetical protein